MEYNNNKIIRLLKRNEIDSWLWDKCVSDSINCRHQALTWHLDIVSPDWQGVVFGDYEAVMPVPVTRKFGVPMVLQPFLTQQLGVFHKDIRNKDINGRIFEFLNKPFPVLYKTFYKDIYNYNSRFKIKPLPNYYLDLNNSYYELRNNFSKNTRRNISKSEKFNLMIKKVEPKESLFKLFYENLRFSFNSTKKLLFRQVIEQAHKRNEAIIYICTSQKEIISVSFFIRYKNRITFVASASNANGYKYYSMFSVFNEVIKEFSGQKIILDFEGSQTPGVARFYKGFGGEEKKYLLMTNFSYRVFKMFTELKRKLVM